MKRIIIFLIRKRLGLKKYECFRFLNQKSPKNYYYFKNNCLMKHMYFEDGSNAPVASHVSLNWILSDECEIEKVLY